MGAIATLFGSSFPRLVRARKPGSSLRLQRNGRAFNSTVGKVPSLDTTARRQLLSKERLIACLSAWQVVVDAGKRARLAEAELFAEEQIIARAKKKKRRASRAGKLGRQTWTAQERGVEAGKRVACLPKIPTHLVAFETQVRNTFLYIPLPESAEYALLRRALSAPPRLAELFQAPGVRSIG